MSRSRSKKTSSHQVAFTRFMIVVGFLALWIGGIGIRLVYLQVNQHEWLKERALDMRQDVRQQKLLRGTIFDRNGRALAMSLPVKTLYADPKEIADPRETAAEVAKVLKLDAAKLTADLKEAKDAGKRFVPLVRKIDDEAAQKINKALDDAAVRKADLPNYTGLHWKDEQKRFYPQQTIASHIVGLSNESDEGVAGIERSQDEVLHGAIIRKLQQRDRLGRIYDEEVTERSEPGDVVLTIDSALQFMVEEALEAGVRQAGARSGMVVVLDPKTGDIISLANYPTFDPNTITSKSAANISNQAIQSVYTPGSVFKAITYGAGLEKRLFRPTDMISSGNGTIEVAKHVFRDSHGVGTVSYSQAMAHSSNVCAIKTALGVGREDFAGLVEKMGFGAKTGVELPAETAGLVRPVSKWNGDSLASMSIGYEIGVTALQMTSAFATIANDGVKVRPRLIKEVRRSDGTASPAAETQLTQVITAESARHLRTMLKQVVMTGTGRRAQLNGYTVAGKTGTAWKFNSKTKSVDPTKYTSSFIGMAPADDPEIVVGVVIDEPTSGARDGGMVAAPVFKEIAQRLLFELKVPTDAPIKQDSQVAENIPDIPELDTTPPERRAAAEKDPSEAKPETRRETREAKPGSKSPPNSKPGTTKDKNIEKEKSPQGRERLTAILRRELRSIQRLHIET